MTIPRLRTREGSLAGAAYTLLAFGLAACALLLLLLLSQDDAYTVAYGANSFTDRVALAPFPDPRPLAVLGTSLLSGQLALQRSPQSSERAMNAPRQRGLDRYPDPLEPS